MIIHHEDGTKLGLEKMVQVRLGRSGRMYFLFQTESGKRGIVELSVEERQKVSASRFDLEVDDESLWRQF